MAEAELDTAKYMQELSARAVGRTEGIAFPEVPTPPLPVVTHLESANRHKDAGQRLPGPTRFAALKSMVLRMARLHTTEQTGFNHAVLGALHALDYNINTARIDTERRVSRLEEAVETAEQRQRDLARQLDRLHHRIVDAEVATAKLGQRVTNIAGDLATQRARLELFLQEARRRLPAPFDEDQLEALTADVDSWLAPLYAQLEETFRGSREQILELQREYLPDVLALGPTGPVVDIGCGRGEWLQLLAENGVHAYGIDSNETFVKQNVERGLDVQYGDAIEHLLSVEPGSIGAVTAFHVVEHLPFTEAVRLLDAALVGLRPGGLLVFETPNPTNLIVGAASFYLDPTHRNPLHPGFLRFLVEARGFVDVEVRYLHPSTDPSFPTPDNPLAIPPTDRLNWAMFGPQDYAVLARKTSIDV